MTNTTTDLAAENTRLRAKIQELTDRVIANIEARSDAEDLQRELNAMRTQWAAVPTTDEAITWLRDLVREFSPRYEIGAISVSMPAATAMKLVAELDKLRTQLDAIAALEVHGSEFVDATELYRILERPIPEPTDHAANIRARNPYT